MTGQREHEARAMLRETVFRGPLGLTFDEEDVIRDLLGSIPEHDEFVTDEYRNALHTARLKLGLHYSGTRGIDVTQAVEAVEWLADFARNNSLPLRFYWNWDDCSYTLHCGDRTWHGDTLVRLLTRSRDEIEAKP